MDPYWQSPEQEASRLERIRKGILLHVKNPSQIMFYVAKSMNDNIVLFEFSENSYVKTSWLSLEEKDKNRHISQGNLDLRSELNPAEEALFGCSVDVVDNGRFLFRMNLPDLHERIYEIVMDSNNDPAIIGTISNVQCRIEYAYVQMKKGMIPDAEYIHLYGRNLLDGNVVKEVIKKDE